MSAGQNIRSFSIIAHIDHGKSTLADRLLERTGTITAREMRAQVLDAMDLERERGITIKMTPVRMNWKKDGQDYVVNLIDTPGHIDFAYEVSRAMKAVEGAVLLVDATQGVEAQTLSVLAVAREQGLVIIPALSKVDAPHARVDDVKMEMATILDIDPSEILETSGKTGHGVPELLDTIIERVPPPVVHEDKKQPQALVFDFQYSSHRGVVIYARMVEGSIKAGDQLAFASSGKWFPTPEVGIFTPHEKPAKALSAGEIGYIVTGLKEPRVASVGDTITARNGSTEALPGYERPAPVIWASVYPEDQDGEGAKGKQTKDDVTVLRQALERLSLSDSSLSWEEEASGVLGRGFRCGFLGMLHLEIVMERLRREFNLELIVTPPSIMYEVTHPGKEPEVIYTPAKFPPHGTQATIREQWVEAQLVLPSDYMGSVMQLLFLHEANVKATDQLGDGRMRVIADMPLRELMRNFFDKLKSVSSGYASVSYRPAEWRMAEVEKLEVLVGETEVPALTRIVSIRRVEEEARDIVSRLKETMPPQIFALKIQAKARGRIIASERLAAHSKDVTGYLYGGDITRRKKLWEKQKKGKKKLAAIGTGNVRIPREVYMNILKGS